MDAGKRLSDSDCYRFFFDYASLLLKKYAFSSVIYLEFLDNYTFHNKTPIVAYESCIMHFRCVQQSG